MEKQSTIDEIRSYELQKNDIFSYPKKIKVPGCIPYCKVYNRKWYNPISWFKPDHYVYLYIGEEE